jgi:hypothetical protein
MGEGDIFDVLDKGDKMTLFIVGNDKNDTDGTD